VNINAYIISVVKPSGKTKQKWEGNIRLNIRRKNCAGDVLKGTE
jgi:hypothetical protein